MCKDRASIEVAGKKVECITAVTKSGDEVMLDNLNYSISIANADNIDYLYAVWVPKYSIAKSVWTVVSVLLAIVGMLLLAVSGALDIKKLQDYAPPSPVTIVTHITVTITQTPSTSISLQFVTQAAFDNFRERRRHKSTTDIIVV